MTTIRKHLNQTKFTGLNIYIFLRHILYHFHITKPTTKQVVGFLFYLCV